MSDLQSQALANLTYEMISTTVDHLAFYKRLSREHPNLVTEHDISTVEERLKRLRTMFKSLQTERRDG